MQKIIFIENDIYVSRMYERVFRHNQCDVVVAADGIEALRKLETMIEPPDAILFDAALPIVSECDFLKEIKSDSRFMNIPVVILANTSENGWREKMLEEGADHFLLKMDTSTDEIVSAVTKLILAK